MGVYYFARCDSMREYFTPGGIDVGQKGFEVIHNDFRGVLFSLLAEGYPPGRPVWGRWCGEAVAIGNDSGGGPDTIELDDTGYTDISPIVKKWLGEWRDDSIWLDERIPEGIAAAERERCAKIMCADCRDGLPLRRIQILRQVGTFKKGDPPEYVWSHETRPGFGRDCEADEIWGDQVPPNTSQKAQEGSTDA